MGKSAKATDILAQTEQDRDDTRQREASLQQTIADLQAVLFNEAGLERLANITDEEWQRAEDEDNRS